MPRQSSAPCCRSVCSFHVRIIHKNALISDPIAFKSRFVTPAVGKTTKTRKILPVFRGVTSFFLLLQKNVYYVSSCMLLRFYMRLSGSFFPYWNSKRSQHKGSVKKDNTRALPLTGHKIASIRRVTQDLYTVLRERRPAAVTTNSEACNL